MFIDMLREACHTRKICVGHAVHANGPSGSLLSGRQVSKLIGNDNRVLA